MTEAEVRGLLRDYGGFGGLEAWGAGRRWTTAPGGWVVTGELQGGSSGSTPSPVASASAPARRAPATYGVGRHTVNGQRGGPG
jgi:hypothetical protein